MIFFFIHIMSIFPVRTQSGECTSCLYLNFMFLKFKANNAPGFIFVSKSCIKHSQYFICLKQNISWKPHIVLCPFRSMSAISNNLPVFTLTSTTSFPSFSTPKKDRREGRWCVTDAIFRLSVREINIDTLCFLGLVDCVCWALISLSSAQPLFS